MHDLQFVADLIKALAWPVAVLVIVLLVRRPVLALLPSLRHLKYKDIELDFDRRVAALAADAAKQLPPPGAGTLSTATASRAMAAAEQMARLAEISPRAVVLESWIEVRSAALEALERKGVRRGRETLASPLALGEALERAGVLDAPRAAIFHELRNLRNAAAHAPTFSLDPGSALDYAHLAERLAMYLREAT